MSNITESPARPMVPTDPDESAPRIHMFGVEIDAITMPNAVQRIVGWLDEPADGCRFVVTPNVDHTVMLQSNDQLRQVYRDAALVLADGLPLVLASRLLGRPLPERVAGSELVPLLLDAIPADRQLRCFLLGAAPGVSSRAAEVIRQRWSGIKVVGTYSPPLGFETDPQEDERILTKLREADPELIIVGLGAPKQELWVHRHLQHLPGRVALCVGATIDFIAGKKSQAPIWMRRSGLEWLHRVATEPRRLTGRYAKDAWTFPQLVWREWRRGRAGQRNSSA